jgi:hypothetical protein
MDANFNQAVQTLKAVLQDVMEVMIAILQLFLAFVMALHALAVAQLLSVITTHLNLKVKRMTLFRKNI